MQYVASAGPRRTGERAQKRASEKSREEEKRTEGHGVWGAVRTASAGMPVDCFADATHDQDTIANIDAV